MDQIYRNAVLTICVASSTACTDGFLQRREYKGRSKLVVDHSLLRFPCPNGTVGTILVKDSRAHFIQNEPLYTRGWTFQEQALSSRVLVYGSWQVWWECLEGKRCDKGNPNSIHSSNSTADSLPLHGRIRRVEKLSYGLNHGPDFLRAQWTDMIEYYTDRRLTFSSESFPHLLG